MVDSVKAKNDEGDKPHRDNNRARAGWVYCAAVIDAYSRMVLGWSIGDHLRSELVVDSLEMER